jgi:hypothetical protein
MILSFRAGKNLIHIAACSIAVLLLGNTAAAADGPTITQAELVRRTQELMTAVAPGDHRPWQLYLADDAMLFDEQGHDMDKTAFLADLKPLPSGYSGSITIVGAKSRFARGVAILSYDESETETIFGQPLRARYHATDTWLYRNGLWQIAASQTLRYYEDPATGSVSESLLNDYLGKYELTHGDILTITKQGDALFAQRSSGQPYKLLPESPDLFFRAGSEGRRLFRRDPSGRVDAMIDRRNNEDLVWKKLP